MKYFKSLQFVNETAKSIEDETITKESANDNWHEEESAKRLVSGKKTKGRIKLKIEYMRNKVRRLTTFSKRKIGMMKKAYELAQLTGAQVMLLVGSETGHVYTFATDKLQPMVTSAQGKRLIESCLRDHTLIKAETSQPPDSQLIFNENLNSSVISAIPSIDDEAEAKPGQVDKVPSFICTSDSANSETHPFKFNQLTHNMNIGQHLLTEPKGPLKKLCADIYKQSKKGNCSMSINRHKIEHSPLKRLRTIVPQNDINKSNVYNCPQNDFVRKLNVYNLDNKLNYLNVDCNVLNDGGGIIYNNLKIKNIFKKQDENGLHVGESTVEMLPPTKSKVENNLNVADAFGQTNLQVMVSPIDFNLMHTNVIKNAEYHFDDIAAVARTTNEAINLIKNK